jgi:hypothetical protein
VLRLLNVAQDDFVLKRRANHAIRASGLLLTAFLRYYGLFAVTDADKDHGIAVCIGVVLLSFDILTHLRRRNNVEGNAV